MLCKKGVNHFGAAYKQVLSSPFDILPLPPATAGFGYVEHRVQQGPARNGRPPSVGFGLGHQGRYNRPLGVR
jgi:hypothetical protein